MDKKVSTAIISLFKGIVYRQDDPLVFATIMDSSGIIKDYCKAVGLSVYIEEAAGYAYLRQIEYAQEEHALPKLIGSRPLSFKVSLLCALLRNHITKEDLSAQSSGRVIVSIEDIRQSMLAFTGESFDELKQRKELQQTVKKVVDLGFLKPLKGEDEVYEIKRVINSFIDAQWLDAFDKRLQEYEQYAKGEHDG